MQQECLGTGDKDYCTAVAGVTGLRDTAPLVYLACPTDGCGKKLVEEGPGVYRCERCVKSVTEPDPRFSFSLQIGDETGQQWVSAFNDTGRVLFAPLTPQQVHDMQASGDPTLLTMINNLKASGSQHYTFRIRARQDTYNGETRVKYNITSCTPIDIHRDNEQMLTDVERMMVSMSN